MTATRNHVSGVCIFMERIIIREVRAPAPAEWIEIFHHKFITVTAIARNAAVIMNAFINSGI